MLYGINRALLDVYEDIVAQGIKSRPTMPVENINLEMMKHVYESLSDNQKNYYTTLYNILITPTATNEIDQSEEGGSLDGQAATTISNYIRLGTEDSF